MVSNLKNHLKDPIKQGDIVKYSNPYADGKDESSMRFVVLEDNGDRVEIKAINKIVDSLSINPVNVISKNHLVKVSRCQGRRQEAGGKN